MHETILVYSKAKTTKANESTKTNIQMHIYTTFNSQSMKIKNYEITTYEHQELPIRRRSHRRGRAFDNHYHFPIPTKYYKAR